MTVGTLFRYLVGQKSAIKEIAGDRRSLWIGFVFCLSAALARHYDGKYLVREPWFLLAPAGASILTSSILFLVIYVATSVRARKMLPDIVPSYLSFLGLYWLTAPLAWLYGIPYERLLSDVHAAQANVWTLELVSVWRVLLISRVVAVLSPSSFFSAFTKVAVPAFALFYTGIAFARMPLIDIMGGVRLPPSVEPVASAYFLVVFFGFFPLLIGGVIWLVSLLFPARNSTLEGFRVRRSSSPASARGVLPLAVVVIIGFSAALPITQREQRLRYQVEKDLKDDRMDQALNVLTSHRQSEFPPQWTPPPWPEYGDGARNPSLVQIVKALQTRSNVPEWLQSVYREKAALYLVGGRGSLRADDKLLLKQFSDQNSSEYPPR